MPSKRHTAVLFAVLLLPTGFGAGETHAQAIIEYGMLARQAAQLTGEQRSLESSLSERFRTVSRAPTTPRRGGGRFVQGLAGPRPRPRSGAPGTVSGVVLDRESGAPVAGVGLLATSTEPEWIVESYGATTDSAGRYRFARLEPGTWAITLDPEASPHRYAPEPMPVITLPRSGRVALGPIRVVPGGCVEGRAIWADGVPLLDGEITVAPLDTSLLAVARPVDEGEAYQVCCAPADSVMVWINLFDGRRLGRSLRVAPEGSATLDFEPQSFNRMRAANVQLDLRTSEGSGVGLAEVLVVGGREETNGQPALVYAREVTADRTGFADLFLPPGRYRILAMNPREGEFASISSFEVPENPPSLLQHELILEGTSTASQRDGWRRDLFSGAITSVYRWAR